MKTTRFAASVGVALLGVACADIGTTPSADVSGALAAFESVPAGFSSTSSSFAAEGDLDGPFLPRRGDGIFEERRPSANRGGGDGRGSHRDRFGFLMGGGLGPDYFGRIGFGIGRGPFHLDRIGDSCFFVSSTGLVTCGPVTRRGLTLLVVAEIKTAAGGAQARIDSLTNSIVLHSDVSGAATRRDSATSTINHTSDRTVTGLARSATRLTVDGIAAGTETTDGITDGEAFDAIRTVNDTTAGIVIPKDMGRPTYPMAGRVSRNMTVSVTIGGATRTHARSEVVTYDGSAAATVVITQDGVVQNCTMALPIGRLECE